jgi:hypothetical protein
MARALQTALGAAVLLSSFAALAQGADCNSPYCRSYTRPGGACLFWSTRGHSYQIDSQGTPDVPGSGAFDAVRKSFLTWAAVTCSDLAFPDLGLSTNPNDRRVGYFAGQYNRNLVLWRTANCELGGAPANDPCLGTGMCGNKYDCWDHGDAAIAVTTTSYNPNTGEIYDADIEMNDSNHSDGTKFQFTIVDQGPGVPICSQNGQANCIGYDVQNTVTHEAGHSIGFAHSPLQDSTMYAFAPEGDQTKRTLHTEDTQGVCDVYPKGKPTSTCLGDPITLTSAGSSDGGGCGCSQKGNGAPAGALLALIGMYLLRSRSPSRHQRTDRRAE